MIAIVNVDKNVRKTGPHEYEVRINSRVVTRFTHSREDALKECLLKAAVAVEEKTIPDLKGMVQSFFEPRYDDIYFEGLERLEKL